MLKYTPKKSEYRSLMKQQQTNDVNNQIKHKKNH